MWKKLGNLTITSSAESEDTIWSLTAAGEERLEAKKQELKPEADGNPEGSESARQWLWWPILKLARDFIEVHCVEVSMAAEEEPITRFTVPNIWRIASSSSSSSSSCDWRADQKWWKWPTKLISQICKLNDGTLSNYLLQCEVTILPTLIYATFWGN